MYKRILEDIIKSKFGKGKAIIVVGARQVGKTTLIKQILKDKDYVMFDCDDPPVRLALKDANSEELKSIIGKNKYVFIDEAQRIEGMSLTAKIIVDKFPDVQLLISGSSSFDIRNTLSEPLTGRKWELELFPISWEEFEMEHGTMKALQQLEERLIYGMYPDVLNNPADAREILKLLVDSYLYKDILAYSNMRKSEYLDNLLFALALQVGNEVNYNELAQTVGINKITIQKYIEILEKGYIIFRIKTFSKNLRSEIKKSRKIYFYDNGIRNTIINNFMKFNIRADKGALWENFLMSERRKQNINKSTFKNMYFWRTKLKQEIDLIEEKDGNIEAFEFKWKSTSKKNIPKTFSKVYKSTPQIINKKNFRNFVVI